MFDWILFCQIKIKQIRIFVAFNSKPYLKYIVKWDSFEFKTFISRQRKQKVTSDEEEEEEDEQELDQVIFQLNYLRFQLFLKSANTGTYLSNYFKISKA
jgi:hypothetical protein